MSRKPISAEIQARLLAESRRRCAICFGLNGALNVKRGQLAHLDKDPSNSSPENIIFLCLEHHDEYDSSTSQSKNLTKGEILEYQKQLRAELERRWTAGELITSPPTSILNIVLNVKNVGGAGGAGGLFGGGGGGGGAAGGSGGNGG
ncbi:MAG: hypothetical protein EOO54_20130, partial [Haliea sp.]